MKLQLLGGLSARQFLSRHWQKRPLLVRGAVPGFAGFADIASLKSLARGDNVESRLVWQTRGRWHLKHGPLTRADFSNVNTSPWTLLVQGINLHLDEGDALMRRFNFIPAARLDDVMVSYAAPGGGVGPHRDAYDVFLLQGPGRRRWRIGLNNDARLKAGAPLALIENFRPEEEYVLEPGDMLYLPPHYAHEGTALDACYTYSIGFRAPAANELARVLLDRLDESLDPAAMPTYADPGIAPARDTARIPSAMLDFARSVENRLRLDRARIHTALGEYLTEPKALVNFEAPKRDYSLEEFARELRRYGARLDRRTQMLHDSGQVYINGERIETEPGELDFLRRLADARSIPPNTRSRARIGGLLHQWHAYGWLHLDHQT